MKKVIILFILFYSFLYGEWKVKTTEFCTELIKESTDKKGVLHLLIYSKEANSRRSIMIEGEKELDDRDAKVVVEYKSYKKNYKDTTNYFIYFDGWILNAHYSDVVFDNYFKLCEKLTVYVDNKKLYVFDLEGITKLLISAKD